MPNSWSNFILFIFTPEASINYSYIKADEFQNKYKYAIVELQLIILNSVHLHSLKFKLRALHIVCGPLV